MKKLSVLAIFLAISIPSMCQQIVKWSHTATKIKDKTYEIRFVATIASGWFIYSQKQPQESSSRPAEIEFVKNPLLSIPSGPLPEEGKLIEKNYPELGFKANTYKKTVTFVQTVTVKKEIKTDLKATVHYQVCNDEMCMPPEDAEFTIELQ